MILAWASPFNISYPSLINSYMLFFNAPPIVLQRLLSPFSPSILPFNAISILSSFGPQNVPKKQCVVYLKKHLYVFCQDINYNDKI